MLQDRDRSDIQAHAIEQGSAFTPVLDQCLERLAECLQFPQAIDRREIGAATAAAALPCAAVRTRVSRPWLLKNET